MPTYQYVCADCNEPLEVVQRFSDDALTECPACAGRLRKVFSAAGIIFKGSGFYVSERRKEGAKVPSASGNSSSENGSSKSDSGKSESSKSESKPSSSGDKPAAKAS